MKTTARGTTSHHFFRYHISQRTLHIILLMFLILYCNFLFVCNAEGIPLVDGGNIGGFREWIGTPYFLLSYGTLCLIWGFLYLLFGNLFVSFCILETATFIWGIANRITFLSRQQYISAADFKLLGEAGDVQINFSSIYAPYQLIILIMGILVGAAVFFVSRKPVFKIKLFTKKLFVLRLLLMLLLIIAYTAVFRIRSSQVWLQSANAFSKTGTIVWLNQSFFQQTSKEAASGTVRELYNRYKGLYASGNSEAPSKKPNIIVIMSESFWDISNLGEILELEPNPMETYNRLAAESISGQTAVNTYGGGTNTTEFEFLTGLNAMNFKGLSDYYGVLYGREQDSFVSYLSELGYYTMALHPYNGSFWCRNFGYYNMGFDAFYDRMDFENREIYHGYLSDHALTQEIIDRFNEQKQLDSERPVFSFSVSIQNHVYDLKYAIETPDDKYNSDISISYAHEGVDTATQLDVEEYVNGIAETADALEELIEYFKDYEEDTMIVFFGDHAPSFATTLFKSAGSKGNSSLYRTPYLIWTNYENDYPSYGDLNVSYLSSVLIEYLGLPRPQQYYVNDYLMEHYPVNTRYEGSSSSQRYLTDMQNSITIANYIHNSFPTEENALSFWHIAE
ncbi:MAG: LTA synthase family protein [Acetatifactor sp.]